MKKSLSLTFLVFLLFSNNYIFAYDGKITHPNITENAIRYTNLENYLTQNLGFPLGTKTILQSGYDKSIVDWLKKGSTDEDSPMCRPSNHFHNPLKPWNESMMSDQPSFVNWRCSSWIPWYSNITWATGYLSPPPDGQKATFNPNPLYAPNTWDNARDYYYNALTFTSTENRESFLAETFKVLGF